MNIVSKILFPYAPNNTGQLSKSLLILSLRLLLGILFLKHGLDKWDNFALLQETFPDPLGITSRSSLILAIFGELICSIGFILGFLFRLAMIPMITTMLVAYFIVHGADPFAIRELAFIYLSLFLILLVSGPGNFSIDSYIGKLLAKKHAKMNGRIRNPMM